MIPFSSQRGYGQDLATHLLNTHDNEVMEIADVRGAIARDLHGAFSEWEAQAHALTNCRNYLYSLSINPDPAQGPLTRDQYLDYIARTEKRLGLESQPRAVVFHSKHGREHCHVVWSRIDVENSKAVHMAFDRQSLMMVTKEFAKDHGLSLPEGYEKGSKKSRQLSLYEKLQQEESGLTKEQRIRDVTEAWQQSDTARAFVHALEDRGYILATGKRPYVLIDIYGHMNALPKLIDDRQVRTKDIRAFLEAEFPEESLPTVDEARKLAAKQLKELGNEKNSEQADSRRNALAEKQERRRDDLDARREKLEKSQAAQVKAINARHDRELKALTDRFRRASKEVRDERNGRRAKGLAAFLGRVTGVQLVTKKYHAFQDRKRHRQFLAVREELAADHAYERQSMVARHKLQRLDIDRHFRVLGQLDRRERKALELTLKTTGANETAW